jgi:hypothetical protein
MTSAMGGASDVSAVGNCAGSPQFTHVAFDDFRVVRDALNGGREQRGIGWCRIASSKYLLATVRR